LLEKIIYQLRFYVTDDKSVKDIINTIAVKQRRIDVHMQVMDLLGQ